MLNFGWLAVCACAQLVVNGAASQATRYRIGVAGLITGVSRRTPGAARGVAIMLSDAPTPQARDGVAAAAPLPAASVPQDLVAEALACVDAGFRVVVVADAGGAAAAVASALGRGRADPRRDGATNPAAAAARADPAVAERDAQITELVASGAVRVLRAGEAPSSLVTLIRTLLS